MLHLLLKHCDFLNINISQGSVATCLGCGAVFKYDFVANFLSLTVKELENQLTFGEVTDRSIVSCFFDSQCIYVVSLINQVEIRRSKLGG